MVKNDYQNMSYAYLLPLFTVIAGRNVNNLRYTDDTSLMAESEEPLDEGERGE